MDILWQLWQLIVTWAGIVWQWLSGLRWTDMRAGLEQLGTGLASGWSWLFAHSAPQVEFLANLITIVAPIVAYIYRGFLADIFIRFDTQEQRRVLGRFLELTTASIRASHNRLLADAQKNQQTFVDEIHNNRYVFRSKMFDVLYKEWQQANNELRNNIKYIESKRFDKMSTVKLMSFQAYVEKLLQT